MNIFASHGVNCRGITFDTLITIKAEAILKGDSRPH